MAAKLIQPTDTIEVSQVAALLYGQPGSRKSSLAQTAEAPITFAFDPGIYRAFGRKAAVLFDSWSDVLSFDASPYRTIVVDTIGMCLDKLSLAIIESDAKAGNRLGGLTLQGYGKLKAQFANWVAGVRAKGQDLVFIAHEKAERFGDEVYYCPDIVGGSYNTLMNHCDIVGYMHFENGKRVLDFAPTDRWMAKVPPCGWTQIALPDFEQRPAFLGELLAEAKASMGRVSAESAKVASVVDEWELLLTHKDMDLFQFNAAVGDISKMKAGPDKTQVWNLTLKIGKDRGWKYSQKTRKFEAPEEVPA